ncbi:NAA38, partial [Symbiodinium sp. KB8]
NWACVFCASTKHPRNDMATSTEGLSEADLSGKAEATQVRALLDTLVQVTVSDGRVIMGTLKCVDGLGNIVLGQAELARSPDAIAAESPQQRRQQWMGSVMVPGANVQKVQVPATA